MSMVDCGFPAVNGNAGFLSECFAYAITYLCVIAHGRMHRRLKYRGLKELGILGFYSGDFDQSVG